MHGAGNDFILVDDRAQTFPVCDNVWLARIAARRTGIGCEGVILIQPSEKADFRMRFFNPDGNEVEMCGNGARCVARLAREIGAAPERMKIETIAGVLEAEVDENMVRLHMTPPTDYRMDQWLPLTLPSPQGGEDKGLTLSSPRGGEDKGEELNYSFVNTGVPHVVVEADDIDTCDVQGLGARIRYHDNFAPAGANANFISVTGPQSLRIRTYERGVEAETLACGTGIVAGALIAARLGRTKPPVSAMAASGDILTVDFQLTAEGAENVTLLGPAVHVFKGILEYQ